MSNPEAIFKCPDCKEVLLIVMDSTDKNLPNEIATKVDAHECGTNG